MLMCPNDQTTLVVTDRGGIEIDHCPTCRGVWLDRGELDKILDRSWDEDVAAPEPRSFDDDRRFADDRGDDEPRSFDDDRRFADDRREDEPRSFDDDRRFAGGRQDDEPRSFDDDRRFSDRRDDDDRRHGQGGDRRRRKESFLANLFDF